MRQLMLVAFCLSLTSCAQLLIRDDDSTLTKTAKVVARGLISIPTLGISEGTLWDIKETQRFKEWRNIPGPCHPATEVEWESYVEDRKLLAVAESVEPLFVASWIGDYLGFSVNALNILLLVETPSDSWQTGDCLPLPQEVQSRLFGVSHR